MPEVLHSHASSSTNVTSTSATYENPSGALPSIPAASFLPNTKYLIIASGVVWNDITNQLHLIKVTDGGGIFTIDPGDNSEQYAEAKYSDLQGMQYQFVRSYTTKPSGLTGQLEFQIAMDANPPGSGTVHLDQTRIIAINLDDLGAANYIEDTNNTAGTVPVPPGDTRATLTLQSGKTYVVLGCARFDGNSTNTSMTTVLRNGVPTTKSFHRIEGEHNNDFRIVGYLGYFDGSVNTTVEIHAQAEGADFDWIGSYLIALDVAAFEAGGFQFQETLGTIATSGTTPVTVNTITSYTPPTAADHLIMFGVGIDATGTGRSSIRAWVERAAVVLITGDGPTIDRSNSFDVTDQPHAPVVGLANLAASVATYTGRGAMDTSVSGRLFQYRTLMLLTLNKAGGAPVASSVPRRRGSRMQGIIQR